MKYTCFIDTSSYINLSKIEYNFGTLLKLLEEKVQIRFSPEVNSVEIPNHYTDLMHPDQKRMNFVYHTSKYSYDDYNKRLFNKTSKNDKGERDNLSATIDMYFDKRKKNL